MARPSRLLLIAAAALGACESAPRRDPVSSVPADATPAPSPQAPDAVSKIEGLEVTRAPDEVVVTSWAEPKYLPPGGGIAQILVRTQRRGGIPFPGVEVRLKTNAGTLYSAGRVLITDRSGMTRDRLTTTRSAQITMNAGGTRFRFLVPVLPDAPD
jgi:hypothetical protein